MAPLPLRISQYPVIWRIAVRARARCLLAVASAAGCVLVLVACGGSSPVAARGSSPVATCGGSSSALATSKQLVAHYEPSQPTGWKFPAPTTLGGHRSCVQVSYGHKTYRISLLSFGQAGSSPNPVYEAAPKDSYVAFKKTLAQAFGRHYVFRYLSGLPSGAKFVVESYSVYVDRTAKGGAKWGADLYAIYEPGKTGPAIKSDVNFIQVVYASSYVPPGYGKRFVDNQYPNVPYAGEGAGLTSINGHRIVNYYDHVMISSGTPQSQVFRAETFLVKDTGRRNAVGKIVDIYGGIKWGFAFKTVE